MFKKIELWVVLLIITFGCAATYSFGVIVRNIGHQDLKPISAPIIFILELPRKIKNEFFDRIELPTSKLPQSLADHDFSIYTNQKPFVIGVEERSDAGSTDFKLVEVSTEAETILFSVTHSELKIIYVDLKENFLYALSKLGDITKYDIGQDSISESWTVQVNSHHEIFVDESGTIFSPIYIPLSDDSEKLTENLKFFKNVLGGNNSRTYGKDRQLFREDGVIVIDTDGNILSHEGFTKLFHDNGMEALIYGVGGLEVDPYHINSVYPAQKDFPANGILKGDLLVSLRHRSMLLIYRPSSRDVIWYQIGPWVNQHSAKFDEKGNIFVFNNTVVDTHNNRTSETAAFFGDSNNEIIYYDFSKQKSEERFSECIPPRDIQTKTGGSLLVNSSHVVVYYSNSGISVLCNPTTFEKHYIAKLDGKQVMRGLTHIQTKR